MVISSASDGKSEEELGGICKIFLEDDTLPLSPSLRPMQ